MYPSILQLCDLQTCPNCFGTDMCNEIQQNKIELQYESLSNFMYNVFSVKNVYFARYNNKMVVLKKLAHNSELKELNKFDSNSFKELINLLVSDSSVKNFRICDSNTAASFVKKINHKSYENLHTLLQINVEPILLELFNYHYGWCVPKLYGYCGRLVVIENAGQPLNHIKNFKWFDRAYVAYQILEAMNNFTENHEIFRLYLTDVSPDNIAVNEDLKVSFIDLENAILKKKEYNGTSHHSEHFIEDSYMYSEVQICDSSISDHNIYSTCRLLLSNRAPWPMMENGLLHDPPEIITKNYKSLFVEIELCVYSPDKINRFKLSNSILNNLRYVLKNYTKYI